MITANRRRFLALTAIGLGGAAIGGRVIVGAVAGASVKAPGNEFDEIYQGRRIQGMLTPPDDVFLPSDAAMIDGRPLIVIRHPGGGFVSVMDRYWPAPTLRDAARRAVDRLRGGDLDTDRLS